MLREDVMRGEVKVTKKKKKRGLGRDEMVSDVLVSC